MEFYPIEMRCDYMKSQYAITDKKAPIFSWGAVNSEKGAFQETFRIAVYSCGECLWDSGKITSKEQSIRYSGENLKSGAFHEWKLELTDNFGNVSRTGTGKFKTACFDEWQGEWI